ncbi:hypothetical protein, partial [Atlantibacter hermannii]|uniref:hypothetical protein n=1 Tax=Atlantibacter hermannii TaxID=565 RepID=UPI0028A7084C
VTPLFIIRAISGLIFPLGSLYSAGVNSDCQSFFTSCCDRLCYLPLCGSMTPVLLPSPLLRRQVFSIENVRIVSGSQKY